MPHKNKADRAAYIKQYRIDNKAKKSAYNEQYIIKKTVLKNGKYYIRKSCIIT